MSNKVAFRSPSSYGQHVTFISFLGSGESTQFREFYTNIASAHEVTHLRFLGHANAVRIAQYPFLISCALRIKQPCAVKMGKCVRAQKMALVSP